MTHSIIHSVIFDWSGTLSDDIQMVFGTILYMFDRLGLERISIEEFRREFTLPYMLFWTKYAPNLTKKEADKIFHEIIFDKVTYPLSEPTPFTGVGSILNQLFDVGYQLFVVSSHPQKKLEEEAKTYKWSKYFLNINGGCHNKTQGLTQTLQKNNIKVRHAVYVGDMVHDVEAANTLRLTSIALTWGYDSKEKLKTVSPNYLINNITELPKCLKR